MNTMKKNGGFTLVELIIVIAILAILSTAAIAGYSTYIQSANDAAVNAVLSDISTSAILANAKAGGIASITVKGDATSQTIVVTAAETGFDTDEFVSNFISSLGAIDVKQVANPATEGTYEFTVDIDRWESSAYKTDGATWSTSKWNITE